MQRRESVTVVWGRVTGVDFYSLVILEDGWMNE